MRTLTKPALFVALALIVLGVNCGNGEEKCDPPDPELIQATISIGAGGLLVGGSAGSVEPGATVTITDGDGTSTTTTANSDGSFSAPFGQSNSGVGDQLTITQKTDDCAESDGTSVTITGP